MHAGEPAAEVVLELGGRADRVGCRLRVGTLVGAHRPRSIVSTLVMALSVPALSVMRRWLGRYWV
jgi:hypothetical protein